MEGANIRLGESEVPQLQFKMAVPMLAIHVWDKASQRMQVTTHMRGGSSQEFTELMMVSGDDRRGVVTEPDGVVVVTTALCQ